VNGALGALIGTGVDALHKGRTTIYRPAPVASAPAGRRAMVSFAFQF
jgi:hypothetical protein